MPTTPVNPLRDRAFDTRLAALQASPAWERILQCYAAAYHAASLACEYQQEAEYHLEHYLIQSEPLARASQQLDRAFDNYFRTFSQLFDHSTISEINLSQETLHTIIEDLLRQTPIT